jgi:hypothetical protein
VLKRLSYLPGGQYSSSPGDLQITATVNGVTSSPFSITTHTPYRLIQGNIVLEPNSTFGYRDSLNYTIQDQMGNNIPSPMLVNEDWNSGVYGDYAGTN